MENINVIITRDQLEVLGEYFNVDIDTLENYELGELVDRAIDSLVCDNI